MWSTHNKAVREQQLLHGLLPLIWIYAFALKTRRVFESNLIFKNPLDSLKITFL